MSNFRQVDRETGFLLPRRWMSGCRAAPGALRGGVIERLDLSAMVRRIAARVGVVSPRACC